MSDLNQALVSIRSIRRQVAQTTEFRGYGPLTLSATAVMALAAGVAQARWLPTPVEHPEQYVALWLTTAVCSAALIATQMFARANRLHSGMAQEMVQMAVLHFLPAGMAGAVLPFVLLHSGQSVLWMLPGLWQVIFSLGVFASCRCLPRTIVGVGCWFLLSGMTCLWLGDARALQPVTMAGAYVPGMAIVAVLHSVAARKARGEDNEVEEN